MLTDVVMPGLGGRTTSEVMEKEYPGLKVLYMSGYTNDTVVRHGIRFDRVPYLQKPFAPAALSAKVREVLDAAGPLAGQPADAENTSLNSNLKSPGSS